MVDQSTPGTHRLLPASSDAEEGVLSSFLLSPREVGGYCAEHGIRGDHFHIPANELVFRRLMDMWADDKPCDLITFSEYLRDRKEIDICGGAGRIAELLMHLPTSANVGHYVQIVKEKHTLREIIKICSQVSEEAYGPGEDSTAVLARAESQILGLSDAALARTAEVPFKRHIMDSIQRAQEAYERGGALRGLPTGLKSLDRVTNGLCQPDFVVVAAETSGGKTALACRFLEACAIEAKLPAAVFSFEMSNEQVTDRLLASVARVDLLKWRAGDFRAGDFAGATAAAAKLSPAKLWLEDRADLTMLQVRAKARRLARRQGVKLVVVDYAQLIPAGLTGRESREQEVAFISRNLKAMGKELGVVVVALSQLNDDGKVRESRALSHDADMLLVVQHEENGDSWVKVAKQRNGPRTRVPVTFIKEFARFEDRYSGADQ